MFRDSPEMLYQQYTRQRQSAAFFTLLLAHIVYTKTTEIDLLCTREEKGLLLTDDPATLLL